MAHFYRVVAVLLLLCATHAQASFTAPAGTRYTNGACSDTTLSDALGTCVYGQTSRYCSTESQTSTNIYAYYQKSQYYANGYCQFATVLGFVKTAVTICPANSTGTTSCTCNSGYVENPAHNGCVVQPTVLEAVCQAKVGQSAELTYLGTATVNGCYTNSADPSGAGCAMSLSDQQTITLPASAGGPYTAATGTFTGGVCQGAAASMPATTASAPLSAASAPVSSDNPCPNGQPGTVNGASVCLPFPTNSTVASSDASTKTVTNPDGTKVKTDVSDATTCKNGSCTTTTTTTTTNINSGGTVTGTATSTELAAQSKESYCSKVPASPQCQQTDSTFGGSCSGGYTCTGDAVQCAAAKEIYTQNCKWNDTTSAEYLKYSTMKAATGDQSGTLPGSTTVAVNSSSFDSTDAIGGAAGLSDLNVTVHGTSIALPFSTLNPYLAMLGNILVAVTALLCMAIVVGRKS